VEKQGVIKSGVTPPEHAEETPSQPAVKVAAVAELDADFRKRAAKACAAELQK
jgi:hypothetical protein